MPLSNLLHAATGTCSFCHEKADVSARAHRDCQETSQFGWTEMISIAADATRTHSFDEKTLRLTPAEIARRSHGDGATVNEALEEDWKQGVAHSMVDGILTQAEETLLRGWQRHPTARPRLAAAAISASRQPSQMNSRSPRWSAVRCRQTS